MFVQGWDQVGGFSFVKSRGSFKGRGWLYVALEWSCKRKTRVGVI